MSRWTYLIPRLVILVLLALALWMSADPLTRAIVTRQLERSTGGKVDVGVLRWDLNQQKLLLKDLVIGDPRDETRNLLQADMVYVQLDPTALLHGQVLIESGQSSRLMFGTPRTSSGVAADAALLPPRAPFQPLKIAERTHQSISQRWLDQLPPRAEQPSLDNPQLHQVAHQIKSSWQQQLDAVESTFEAVDRKTVRLKQKWSHVDGNPLRWQTNDFIPLNQLAEQSDLLQQTVAQLRLDLDRDLQQLDEAMQQDAAQLNPPVELHPFEGEQINELLLGRMHAQQVDQVMNLVRWFQTMTPEPNRDFSQVSLRGEDRTLAHLQPPPDFLIRSIELNGEGQLLNQSFHFTGHAFDLTTQPDRLETPARFEVRAQGTNHAVVSCTVDRRDADHPVDRFRAICPDMKIDAQRLGDPDSLQLTIGPDSHLQAEIDITISDGLVSGTIQLVHSRVALHVDALNELAGGESAKAQMNAGLSGIHEFQSTIEISGPINNYRHVGSSDLGENFSDTANRLLREQHARSLAKRRAVLEQTRAAEAQQIKQALAQRLNLLESRVRENRTRVAELKSNQSDSSRLRR